MMAAPCPPEDPVESDEPGLIRGRLEGLVETMLQTVDFD